MSSFDDLSLTSIATADLPAEEGTRRSALFAGDAGELPLDTRRALVQLLSGPSL